MKKIPVLFIHDGKRHQGHLSQVSGTGKTAGGVYDLMENNYYCGKLFHTTNYGWKWDSLPYQGIKDQMIAYVEGRETLFYIAIEQDRKQYRLKVERLLYNETHEQYLVSGRNKAIRVQSNRPLFRNKGLSHRRPDWRLVEGEGHNMGVLEKIYEALMAAID